MDGAETSCENRTNIERRRVAERRKDNCTICINEDLIIEIAEYVKLQKERDERRKRIIDNITQNVLGWLLIATIGGIGKLAYDFLVSDVLAKSINK